MHSIHSSVRPKDSWNMRRDAVKEFEKALHNTSYPLTRTWVWKTREAFEEMITLVEEADRNHKALAAAVEAFDKFSPDWRKAA